MGLSANGNLTIVLSVNSLDLESNVKTWYKGCSIIEQNFNRVSVHNNSMFFFSEVKNLIIFIVFGMLSVVKKLEIVLSSVNSLD